MNRFKLRQAKELGRAKPAPTPATALGRCVRRWFFKCSRKWPPRRRPAAHILRGTRWRAKQTENFRSLSPCRGQYPPALTRPGFSIFSSRRSMNGRMRELENTWRKGDDPGTIPNHFVGIKAMSGASAGAIAAAIGAVALADADQKPIEFDTYRDGEQKIKCYLPKIYETWVVSPVLSPKAKRRSISCNRVISTGLQTRPATCSPHARHYARRGATPCP